MLQQTHKKCQQNGTKTRLWTTHNYYVDICMCLKEIFSFLLWFLILANILEFQTQNARKFYLIFGCLKCVLMLQIRSNIWIATLPIYFWLQYTVQCNLLWWFFIQLLIKYTHITTTHTREGWGKITALKICIYIYVYAYVSLQVPIYIYKFTHY